VALGPLELIVLGFPGNKFSGEALPALADLVEQGTIRVIDLLFVGKDVDGTVVAFELADAEDDLRATFGALFAGDEADLLSEEDVEDVAAVIEPGSSAAMLLFEHTWATRFRDAVLASGGVLVDSIRIPAELAEELAKERAAAG
jgi:hypothetical protein